MGNSGAKNQASNADGTAIIGCGMLVTMEANAQFLVETPSLFKGSEMAMPSGILWTLMAMAIIRPNCRFPVAKATPIAIPSGMEWMNMAIKISQPRLVIPLVKKWWWSWMFESIFSVKRKN